MSSMQVTLTWKRSARFATSLAFFAAHDIFAEVCIGGCRSCAVIEVMSLARLCSHGPGMGKSADRLAAAAGERLRVQDLRLKIYNSGLPLLLFPSSNATASSLCSHSKDYPPAVNVVEYANDLDRVRICPHSASTTPTPKCKCVKYLLSFVTPATLPSSFIDFQAHISHIHRSCLVHEMFARHQPILELAREEHLKESLP